MIPLLLRSHIRVIVRLKGGLDLKKVSLIRLAQALETAAKLSPEETLEDILCPNITQNIVVVSTPASRYAGTFAALRLIRLGLTEYRVLAYTAASDDTCKSVIRGVDVDIDERQLVAMIINQRNPKAMELYCIKETTTVILLFTGLKLQQMRVEFEALKNTAQAPVRSSSVELRPAKRKIGTEGEVATASDLDVLGAIKDLQKAVAQQVECFDLVACKVAMIESRLAPGGNSFVLVTPVSLVPSARPVTQETRAAPSKEYRVTDWDEFRKCQKADQTEYAPLEELFSQLEEDEPPRLYKLTYRWIRWTRVLRIYWTLKIAGFEMAHTKAK
ncbi:hypothetical protein HPB51_019050 [Rhipicephalus microplus]|uniref:Uncharacterized protein n=1 Tax=Rhipicephalus microplus TaxID=6941 RepID=A0A9J6D6N1_RHIMP|nr:hypothetical protein HPB51_019050 [Rhipicephalus microplus]